MEETEEKKKRNDHGIPSVGTVSRRRARARENRREARLQLSWIVSWIFADQAATAPGGRRRN